MPREKTNVLAVRVETIDRSSAAIPPVPVKRFRGFTYKVHALAPER